MQCELSVGFFLLRRCGEAARQSCAQCNRPVCSAHCRNIMQDEVLRCLCLDCIRERSSTFTDTTTSSSTGSSAPDVYSTEGDFGGGGASRGWNPPADPAVTNQPPATLDSAADLDTDGFTPADYAAFDEVTTSDRDSGKVERYDS